MRQVRETPSNKPPTAVKPVFSVAVMIGLLFLAYGGVDWIAAWVFIGISVLAKLTFGTYLAKRDPELLRRRRRMQPGTKGWDKAWLGAFVPLFFAILALAGLDAGRYHWSSIPWPVMVAGGGAYIVSVGVTFWAMLTNTHFEGTVRIQRDRDHRVVDTGPYAYVRHPGYIALILTMLSLPVMLGSVIALIPASVVFILFVVRTVLEDRTLKRELAGYLEYTHAVRYRLIPGLW